MGAVWREYPRPEVRSRLIERLQERPEAERAGDDWWQLGEYQVLEGLTSGDERVLNLGSQALMKGAHLSPPHAGCLLDLGWLLCYRGLDQMALFYLDQAVALVPASRDVWSLRGWACIGCGAREEAVHSFRRAQGLPGATNGDQETLEALERGDDLEELRRGVILRKFDDQIRPGASGGSEDVARSGVLQLRQLLERKPRDLQIAYCLANCYYVLRQFDRAEPLLLRVIGEAPDHADALTLLALIAKKSDRVQEQLAYYERAVSADPQHVLANTNLASYFMDRGDFHRARPLLLRAIDAAQEDDPHLPIALDLMGNSVAMIEGDFEAEAALHRRAIELDPKRPLFRANLVVALLSADRAKDAQRALQAAKDARLALPNQSLVENLVRLYQDRSLHPHQYMYLAEQLGSSLGWPALRPIIRRAWERRWAVERDEQVSFLGSLGLQAVKSGARELALEIWREGSLLPGAEALGVNLAVELSNMGRHAEALNAAASMSMDTPRSWTILGNIHKAAGQYRLAIEAYRQALNKDEKFLLPIANALAAAQDGLLAEELDPFIERLCSDWSSSPAAMAVLGLALAFQGRLSSAAERFQQALWDGGTIRSPQELHEAEQRPDDRSVFGEANAQGHYEAARCFLALGRTDLLKDLIEQVRQWPQWMNGDWRVLEAELHLAKGDLDLAATAVNGMQAQAPTVIIAAKIALQRRHLDALDELIALGLKDGDADKFNHPEGQPDAIFHALASQRALDRGEVERSEDLGREAVRRDPTCVRARLALAAALAGRSDEEERRSVLADGLRRAPGHPDLVAELVESLVAGGDLEEATVVLERQRPLLMERGVAAVAYRLGELLAVDRLTRLSAQGRDASMVPVPWPWVDQLQEPLQRWLRGAHLSLSRGDALAAAYGLYMGKVGEYLLVSKILVPFRQSMSDAQLLLSEQHRDVSRFMSGGVAPSIGGMARLLDAASRPYRPTDDELTLRFREAVSDGAFGSPRVLRSRDLVEQVQQLGQTRNSSTHLGDQEISAIVAAARCIVSGDQPGLLLKALGVA